MAFLTTFRIIPNKALAFELDLEQKLNMEMTVSTPATLPKRARRRRAFDEFSLTEYAELASQRLTDPEICAEMGWKFDSFKRWKSIAKNSPRLNHYLVRARAVKLKAHLANIEAAAVGEGPHKRADWRASAHIMQVVDPARYSTQQQPSQVTNQTAIIIGAGGETSVLKMLDAIYQAKLPPSEPMKQIEATQAIDCTNDKPA